MKTGKRTLLLLAIAALVMLPLLWVVARSFYSFLFTDFVVRNTGPTPIRLIALGTTEDRRVLIWSRNSAERQKVIPPGEARSFRYGWNDVNLCWLVVDSAEGQLHVLRTPLEKRNCELTPPTRRWPCCDNLGMDTVLTVPPVAELEPAPGELTSLLSEH